MRSDVPERRKFTAISEYHKSLALHLKEQERLFRMAATHCDIAWTATMVSPRIHDPINMGGPQLELQHDTAASRVDLCS